MRRQNIWAIIPAAGSSRRMQMTVPKQYLLLHGKTILEHSISPFLMHDGITKIVVVIAKRDTYWNTFSLAKHKKIITAEGGEQRCHSVMNALEILNKYADGDDWVIIHDAARPFLTYQRLVGFIDELVIDGIGGILAKASTDTLKQVDAQGNILKTLDRDLIWRAQTPQMFKFNILYKALRNCINEGIDVSDEAMAVERLNLPIKIVANQEENSKITHEQDLMKYHASDLTCQIGHGFDVHAFVPNKPLILGGVSIPYEYGLLAHSDGDVILHALCDALLGASGNGDMGQYFPDTDVQFKDKNSKLFVEAVLDKLMKDHWRIVNVDITLLAEAPKLACYRNAIQNTIADVLSIPPRQVNFKATTTEKLGYIGRKEGIACHANVLLTPESGTLGTKA